MNKYVADTMALVLWLEKRKMGAKAKSCFEEAEDAKAIIFVPAMVLAEMMYLSERGRIECSLADFFEQANRHSNMRPTPLTAKIISVASKISDIHELHDRLIAATARSQRCPLLTNDPVIQASSFLSTIW